MERFHTLIVRIAVALLLGWTIFLFITIAIVVWKG